MSLPEAYNKSREDVIWLIERIELYERSLKKIANPLPVDNEAVKLLERYASHALQGKEYGGSIEG